MAESSVNSSSTPVQLVQVNLSLPSKLKTTGDLARNWQRFRLMWDNNEIASCLRNWSEGRDLTNCAKPCPLYSMLMAIHLKGSYFTNCVSLFKIPVLK